MMRELRGFLGAWSVLGAVFLVGAGCTPTDRNFASGGSGGTGGAGGGCPAGFLECDGNPETVCETDTSSSSDHCGMCGNVCTSAIDATVGCVSGMCSITSCTTDRGNCDNFYENGCETNTNTNADHCGMCGNSCEAPDAITGCVAGACQIASCVMGKLDCDMDAKTGCESDPTSDVNNCGACGMACSAANANMGCTNSQCAIVACAPGFGDCNVEIQDGCEAVFLDNPYHCGMCGNYCKGGACRTDTCIFPEVIGKTSAPPGELFILKDDLLIASRSGGEVRAMSTVLAGAPKLIAATQVGAINAITATSSAIFVAGSTGTARMDWNGLNQYNYGANTGRGVDTDGTLVYWTASNAVRNGPVAGGSNGTFFAHSPLPPVSPQGLVISGDTLYWGTSDGDIWMSPKSPVAAKNIGSGPSSADNLVVDAKNLYWSSSMGIHSMPLGGGVITELAPTSNTVRAIAVDATHVYWTDASAGLILRTLKNGSGKPETLAIEQPDPWGIALTAQFVYWANVGSGEIMKLPK